MSNADPPFVTIERHFDCLKELYSKLNKKWTRIDMYWPYRTNFVSGRGNKVLQEMGIIEKSKDQARYYRWKAGKPNQLMAKRFAAEVIKREIKSLRQKLREIENY